MTKKKRMDREPGRMIRKGISRSAGFSKMSADARALFCMLIPHFNAHGKMNGNPHFIKGEVVPLVESMDCVSIGRCLKEITENTSVKWFKSREMFYIQSLNFKEHQELRKDRLGRDEFPDYSRSNPGPLRHEVEVEVEVEVEEKTPVVAVAFGGVQGGKVKGNDASKPEDSKAQEALLRAVAFAGDGCSRAFFQKAVRVLGPGMVEEAMGEVKMREQAGAVSNRAKYFTALLKDWMKETP